MERKTAIGEIIEISKQLEKELRRLKAEGKGLHEMTDSLSDKLPETLSRRLHMLASIRNKAVHEADYDVAAEFESYKATASEVLAALSVMKRLRQRKNQTAPRQTTGKAFKKSSDVQSNILFLLPFIPAFNIIYFLFMIIVGVIPAAVNFILLAASLAALIAGVHGLVYKANQLAVTCAAVYFAAYIGGMFISGSAPKSVKMLKFFPVFNTAFFLRETLFRVDWKLTLFGLLFCAAAVSGIVAFFYRDWQITGVTLLALSYLGGICHFLLSGKKKPGSSGRA
ncbi:hypothetical protein P0136_06855 [Lentisphaerota bacterium ZTH]|nr:hypothetical protein JYG24_02035 [Lentisphaerota bacterium]WET07708.1 hypothetical protein P0136_06855 [Lentisphaerota bacterium ZTH]